MRVWKILSNMFLIVLLAFTASGIVNTNLASGPENFSLESHQGQSLFNLLPCLEKSEYSTTNLPRYFVIAKRGVHANKAKGDAFRDEIADLIRKEERWKGLRRYRDQGGQLSLYAVTTHERRVASSNDYPVDLVRDR